MSEIKNIIYEGLRGHGVKYVDVTGDIVSIYTTAQQAPFRYHISTHSTPENIVENIRQFLRNRT